MPKTALKVTVDQMKFDPSDESTQRFNSDKCVYQVYLNQDFLALIDPDVGNISQVVEIDNSMMNGENMLRLISKDKTLCPGGAPSNGINDNMDQRVGTIAFKLDEF